MKTFREIQPIGAGLDDTSLLTLKTTVCIKQADIIIYDRLVNPKILEWALPDCLLISVGKDPGLHCVPQDEINTLPIQYTQTRDSIVRLEDGDPYILGCEAEGVEDLVEAGIPFEVMPDISSTIGGLAYAGTPVAHRDLVSGFCVVADHTREGDRQQDWRQLARLSGTLIIVMGIASLASTCEELLIGRKSADTPAALVISTIQGNRHRLTCTLGSLLSKA